MLQDDMSPATTTTGTKGLLMVAVCGARRCGKDTLSDHLCREHGFVKARFAEPLKAMAREAFGFTHDQVEGDAKDSVDPVYGVTPRRVLQFLGTEVMQHQLQRLLPDVGRHFWSRRLIRQYVESNEYERVVVSDMRFLHEWQALRDGVRSAGGTLQVWRIERDTSGVVAQDSTVDAHDSETEWARIPCTQALHNDGSVDDLRASADELLRRS